MKFIFDTLYVPNESHDDDGANDDADDDGDNDDAVDEDDDDEGWVWQGGILFAKQRFKGAKLH